MQNGEHQRKLINYRGTILALRPLYTTRLTEKERERRENALSPRILAALCTHSAFASRVRAAKGGGRGARKSARVIRYFGRLISLSAPFAAVISHEWLFVALHVQLNLGRVYLSVYVCVSWTTERKERDGKRIKL